MSWKLKTGVLLIIVLFNSSCEFGKESSSEKAKLLVGDWKVQWVTDPASYPDADPATNFTMNGEFLIRENGKITINANGYENCIFSTDTLSHTLNWTLVGDTTLSLTNEGDANGLTYQVMQITDNKVKLQLMDDIYLHLTK